MDTGKIDLQPIQSALLCLDHLTDEWDGGGDAVGVSLTFDEWIEFSEGVAKVIWTLGQKGLLTDPHLQRVYHIYLMNEVERAERAAGWDPSP